MVLHFPVVEKPTQRDDGVFTSDALGEGSREGDLCNRRNLPPGLSSSPDAGSVSSYNGVSQASQAAVHVGVAI